MLAPSPLLADGLAIVDTPGMGGLGAGHAAATLSFLPFADGLVFVSDATSEFTATELEFLEQARSLCPNVIMVAPKVDLAPEWRRDRRARRGAPRIGASLDIVVVPVSSVLRTAAFATRIANSTIAVVIQSCWVSSSRASSRRHGTGAADRARDEAIALIDATVGSLRSERGALDDPAANEALQRAATEASARLDALRSGGARWQTVLGDRLADLSSDVNHRFRSSIRDTARRLDERIETLKNAEEWDQMARDLQSGVANAVTQVFVDIEDGRANIRGEIAEMLSADDVVGPTAQRAADVLDTASMWRARGIEPDESKQGKALPHGFDRLRAARRAA